MIQISDSELREMVREAIARYQRVSRIQPVLSRVPDGLAHASHRLLPLASGGDGSGMCLIEPAVRCSHCGYCQSLGH